MNKFQKVESSKIFVLADKNSEEYIAVIKFTEKVTKSEIWDLLNSYQDKK